jgi:hypothetical protein
MKVIQSVDNIAGYIPMWILNLPTSGSSLKVIHRSPRYRSRLSAKRMDDACSKTDPKWGGTNKRSALCTLTTKNWDASETGMEEWSMSPHVWIHQPPYTHVMYIYMMFMLTKSSPWSISGSGVWPQFEGNVTGGWAMKFPDLDTEWISPATGGNVYPKFWQVLGGTTIF